MTSPVPPKIVLASASPRRRELLASVGLDFEVLPVDVDETPDPSLPPAENVLRLARRKAIAAHGQRPHCLVLGADTLVFAGEDALGKPRDAAAAEAMLTRLSARWHQVCTGVALVRPEGEVLEEASTTRVRFARLDPREIRRYAASREPLDKAGAYALQGAGAWFVERLEGSASNVIGLPLEVVRRLLRRAGAPLPTLGAPAGGDG
ncbi:MAG: Maf family protein [Acidobacteriota bacterium]|nr:Maf family protein [Acidobacteriota bacterium]